MVLHQGKKIKHHGAILVFIKYIDNYIIFLFTTVYSQSQEGVLILLSYMNVGILFLFMRKFLSVITLSLDRETPYLICFLSEGVRELSIMIIPLYLG